MRSIDLNADLGEHPGTDLDEQIMPFISSCNIACGGHIGNEDSVVATVRLAKKYRVAVGAHPSYPDKENFGRQVIGINPNDLRKNIDDQIILVKRVCEEENVKFHHVKPHGALYNEAAKNPVLSNMIMELLSEITPEALWMGLANSVSERIATSHGFPFIAEGFADRRYESDGSLRSRSKSDSVLQGNEVLAQVEALVLHHRVKADEWIPMKIQSICLHGDTSGAVSLAKEINEHLESKGIQITAV